MPSFSTRKSSCHRRFSRRFQKTVLSIPLVDLNIARFLGVLTDRSVSGKAQPATVTNHSLDRWGPKSCNHGVTDFGPAPRLLGRKLSSTVGWMQRAAVLKRCTVVNREFLRGCTVCRGTRREGKAESPPPLRACDSHAGFFCRQTQRVRGMCRLHFSDILAKEARGPAKLLWIPPKEVELAVHVDVPPVNTAMQEKWYGSRGNEFLLPLVPQPFIGCSRSRGSVGKLGKMELPELTPEAGKRLWHPRESETSNGWTAVRGRIRLFRHAVHRSYSWRGEVPVRRSCLPANTSVTGFFSSWRNRQIPVKSCLTALATKT